MSTKKNQDNRSAHDPLTETSIKIGKALGRSTAKVEHTGRKAQQTARKLVETAEQTVEEAVNTVKKLGKPRSGKKNAPLSPLRPKHGLSVEGQIGFLAGDIYQYLAEHGEMPLEKVTNVMKRRGNSTAFIHAALGWLSREDRIRWSASGDQLSAA